MAKREFVGFGGVKLHAEVHGWDEDPVVLLIHGGGQTRRMWEPVVGALVQAGRYVVNLELRGHGESEWPKDGRYDLEAYVGDLKAVLAELGSRPAIIAASLGGWIASIALSESQASLATGLVLLDMPPELDADKAAAVSAALKKRVERNRDDYSWDVRFLDAFNVEETLQRMSASAVKNKVPVLFVRGALSDITGRDSSLRFVQQFPDAEFVEIEDSSHLITEERADSFNASLVDFLERRVPRIAPEYRSGSDARTLRDALGCFATGVTVVTAMAPDARPIGLTANAFTSVSLAPPLVLVCIDRKSGSLPILREVDYFGVNILHIGQQKISNIFAKPGQDRFAGQAWAVGEFNTPQISGSLSSFECRRDKALDAGDHTMLLGEVVRANFEPRRDPLLFFGGKYRRLHFG